MCCSVCYSNGGFYCVKVSLEAKWLASVAVCVAVCVLVRVELCVAVCVTMMVRSLL